MYRNKYPKEGMLVVVQVNSVNELGAYVSLVEYDNLEGLILLSDVSRKRIRAVSKLLRIGRIEICEVLRVNPLKGQVDLSKKKVLPEDIEKKKTEWTKTKTVHSIMSNVSRETDIPLEELYEKFGWDLYDEFGHAYNAFHLALSESNTMFLDLDNNVRETLLVNITRRMTPKPLKIRAYVKVMCYSYEGVEAIKTAFRAGLLAVKADSEHVTIRVVAPPIYVITAVSMDKQEGLNIVRDVCAAVQDSIEAQGGKLIVDKEAHVIDESDETEFANLLQKLEEQNKEVDGDEDSD